MLRLQILLSRIVVPSASGQKYAFVAIKMCLFRPEKRPFDYM